MPVDAPLPEGALNVEMFIAMDPPKHDVQRATVSPIVAPMSLKKLEPVIRERVVRHSRLAAAQRRRSTGWTGVHRAHHQMLATLFDFPFEERRKLTRWSDVATAAPGTGIVETEEQRRDELLECLEYFTNLWKSARRIRARSGVHACPR